MYIKSNKKYTRSYEWLRVLSTDIKDGFYNSSKFIFLDKAYILPTILVIIAGILLHTLPFIDSGIYFLLLLLVGLLYGMFLSMTTENTRKWIITTLFGIIFINGIFVLTAWTSLKFLNGVQQPLKQTSIKYEINDKFLDTTITLSGNPLNTKIIVLKYQFPKDKINKFRELERTFLSLDSFQINTDELFKPKLILFSGGKNIEYGELQIEFLTDDSRKLLRRYLSVENE